MRYLDYSEAELKNELAALNGACEAFRKKGLKLDMSRGVPAKAQLDLSLPMLTDLQTAEDCISESGTDYRNYGILDGIPEAKKLFADLLDVKPENVIVCGSSSLNIMYDTVARNMLYGVCGSEPWCRLPEVKFLAPVPGYDRHFAVCQSLGIKLIPVPMTKTGPDMDIVEKLVAEDESIKGIWCVPKFSNPDGTVYSDETVRRFAGLKAKAKDFRIFWDNAYIIHTLYPDCPEIPNILKEAEKAGNPDIAYVFTSTSKITFPGAGVAVVASSDANIAHIKSAMKFQTIGFDKLNQLRHVKFFKDVDGLKAQMQKHADILRPKFECVLNAFRKELTGLGIAEWSEPRGGYFISLNVLPGTAKRVWDLMVSMGVKLTGAGATFPYGVDPEDKNLRIAPSFPTVENLSLAVEALCLAVRTAAVEKLLADK